MDERDQLVEPVAGRNLSCKIVAAHITDCISKPLARQRYIENNRRAYFYSTTGRSAMPRSFWTAVAIDTILLLCARRVIE
jgi:hypothetical protein